MTRTRAWLVGSAVACFVAGVSVGLAAPVVAEAFTQPEPDGDELYVRQFAQKYGLKPRQVRLLRAILAERNSRVDELMRANTDQWPPALRSQRDTIHRWVDTMVQGLLDSDQRDRYLADVRPQPNDK